MEQRAILAVAVSLAILLLYNEFILPTLYPAGSESARRLDDPYLPPDSGVVPPPPAAIDPSQAPAPVAEIASQPSTPAQRLIVETDFYTATLTSHGGRLESFRLKDHRTSIDPDSLGLEMVEPGETGEFPLAVELRGIDRDSGQVISSGDRAAAYVLSDSGTIHLRGSDSRSVEMRWDGPGGTIRKRLSFQGDRREVSVQLTGEGIRPEYTQMGLSWLAPVQSNEHEKLFDRITYLKGRRLTDYTLDDGDLVNGVVVEPARRGEEPSWQWVGVTGNHFLVAMIPLVREIADEEAIALGTAGAGPTLFLKQRSVAGLHPGQMGQFLRAQILFPLRGNSFEEDVKLYLGAKNGDQLDAVGHKLARAVDLGWFSFVALPLLWMLRKCHAITGNYGFDIILVTVLIKIIFLPLTQKSFTQMRGMQKLQPEMQKLRERLKDSPELMQKEMMELYRKHGVNPLGGCLPMIVQIPVFIGLYQALMNAVELRHAPFIGWIVDLSAPDRLGTLAIPFVDPPGLPVLTLVMGGSMFLQQWMTPAMGDPMQQRMMMILPVVFTFMFLSFPAGLVLYWTVNNILTIAQQAYIHRSSPA